MKTAKKSLSILMTLILSVTIFAASPAKAEEEQSLCIYNISIGTPYENYYSSKEVTEVTVVPEDLTDDFGIGLPVDGSDATTGDDGEVKRITAVRAIAKYIRNYIMSTVNATKEEANKLMPKYIDYNASTGWLNGFSNDGEHWNTGAFEDTSIEGTSADGYWNFYTNSVRSGLGIGAYTLGEYYHSVDIELKWSNYTGNEYEAYPYAFISDDTKGFDLASKGIKGTLYQRVFEFDSNYNVSDYKDTPVSGAAVVVYDSTGMEYTHAITDSKGKYQIKDFKPGKYTLVAQKDIKDSAGRTCSAIARAGFDVDLVATPKAPTSVKASAKKKNINVSWKYNNTDVDAVDAYAVYISKKKNSGYKKASEVVGKKVKIKKAKGTYYVKVRHLYKHKLGKNEDYKIKRVYGSYSKPIKVKVK